jgi:hypothetical protein
MHANLFKNKIVVLATFIGVSLIIFAPSSGRIFLSDDYCTLENIVSNNTILLPSFFRPVGDLTLMWTYKIAGWDPFYFYVINILLHALNSFLVYYFCIKWFKRESRSVLFAVAAGMIFLTYPSHSEAILWAIGRGISLAVFFGLLAMIVFISGISDVKKYIMVSALYFIALACYESALLLPLILFALAPETPYRKKVIWLVMLSLVLALHLLTRYFFTGGVWQAYNGIIFSRDIIQYFSTFLKIVLRLFVPPFNYPYLFGLCGLGAIAVLFIVLFRNRNRFETDSLFSKTMSMVIAGLLATIVVTISFGLSTRTSEGDRMMYFPSVFYSILIALLIVRLMATLKSSIIVTTVVIIVQTGFLVLNQNNWIRASEMAVKVINSVGLHPQRPLYIVNLPSDEKGAYVFRNCLPQALMHYNVDTTGVRILNIIQSTEIEKKSTVIVPEKNGSNTFIWPSTLLEVNDNIVRSITIGADSALPVSIPVSSILYWNKQDLVQLKE